MHSIFNHLLAGLCIGDFLFLLCNLLVVPIAFGRENNVINLLYLVAECGCHISLSVSIFLTVSITIERFQVIVFGIGTSMRRSSGRCSGGVLRAVDCWQTT